MDKKDELTLEEKKRLYIIRKLRKAKKNTNIYLTGEDIDMLRENNHNRKKDSDISICDTHEDGA